MTITWQNFDPCPCGQEDWDCEDPEDATCKSCGMGPLNWTVHRTTTHVARKDHHPVETGPDSRSFVGGDIVKAGDKYRLQYWRGYFRSGPSVVGIMRRLITKGPGWAVTEDTP
jgi:hypothetical protein